MAGNGKKDKSGNKPKAKAQAQHKPLRATLAALGVGLAWAALHMPPNMGLHAQRMVQLTWGIHALVAAILTLCVLEIGGAVLKWMLRTSGSLISSLRG